jgi:hypothetical protein
VQDLLFLDIFFFFFLKFLCIYIYIYIEATPSFPHGAWGERVWGEFLL